MSVEIRVPTLGDSVTGATIAKWLKKAGEAVALELEAPASDQAALLAMFDRAEAFVARQP